MKISRKWLDRLVDVADIETVEIADTLTNAGHEVESIEPLVIGTNLVIGKVLTCENHPDSDHLHVCQVDVKDQVLQIVCGAPNVAAGQKVIVALVGAELAGLTIKESTIRGVESKGMICSLKELSLAEDYIPEESKHGIHILDDQAIVGDDPIAYLGLNDEILDIKQTVNRSDFMSMEAIAREVAGIFKRQLLIEEVNQDIHAGKPSQFKVDSKSEKCPRFWAKVIHKVTIKESPTWIKQALRGSGLHPINNLVDISNLVMLETGQPNHFYDYRFFDQPEITVIDDYEGTQVALDGEAYELKAGDIIISSDGQPIGIGGIKGLGNSMIQPDTSSIVIEIASFDSVQIRETSRRLNLLSDASVRYTKPMDALAPEKAMAKILHYLKLYADLQDEDIEETVKYEVVKAYEPHSVSVSLKEINELLGTSISLEQVIDVFKRLNFQPHLIGDRINCKIPSYRNDLWIKEDLIEEVIRILGYDLIESTYPHLELTADLPLTPAQVVIREIEKKATSLNLNQIMSYTLVGQEKIKGENPIKILSPLSENREFVRDQILPSMLETLQYNLDRKNLNQTYFELSQVYTETHSEWHLGIVGSGQLKTQTWNQAALDCNFYTMKGLIEEILGSLGINLNRLSVKPLNNHPSFHPYQSAVVYLDNKEMGVAGVLHPMTGIKKGMACELNLELLFEAKKAKTKFTPLQKYPVVKRDLAIVVNPEMTSEQLERTIRKAGRPLLSDVTCFDVFDLEGQRSLAYSLSFESKDKTLSDQEVSDAMNRIIEQLEKNHKALLRTN